MGNNQTKPNQCIFCELQHNKALILLQSSQYFAFHDITKSSAKQHILICTKAHIKNALELKSPEQMYKMKQFGKKVLDMVSDQKGRKIQDRIYRFGFHLPPYNSVHHIHLHCFVQPFSSFLINKWHFGRMLHSVEDTERKWWKNRGL